MPRARAQVAPQPALEPPGPWRNPFAKYYEEGPGRLVLNLHVASTHIDGIGLAVGFVPWQYLELKASYAYRIEHSVAGIIKYNILPRAVLTPYVAAGYVLHFALLDYDIFLSSHQLAVGAGLQARFLARFFIGAELMVNVVLDHTIHREGEQNDLSVTDRVIVQPGFTAGVYLF